MNRTRSLLVASLLILVLAMPALAFECSGFGPSGKGVEGARGGCHGAGGRQGGGFHALALCLDLSKEQMEKLHELRGRQFNETSPLRHELLQKRLEMRKLFTDPAKDEATILAKQKEIEFLQQKLNEKRILFRLEQRRVLTPDQLKQLHEVPAKHGHRRCWG